MSQETQILQDLITAAQLAGDTATAGQYRWRLHQQRRLEAGEYKHSGSFVHMPSFDRVEGAVSNDPVHLIADFAGAMLEKMRKNTLKREAAGLSDAWHGDDWQEDCVRQLQEHVTKGDPLDVAILSAFCWYHGWPVSSTDTPGFYWLNLMPVPVTWHELKTDEEFMTPLRLRAKTAEIRRDDRGFAIGDGLVLRGWNGTEYTGTVLRFPITSLLRGPKYGLMPGFVMLGLGDEVDGIGMSIEEMRAQTTRAVKEATDFLSERAAEAAGAVDPEDGCLAFEGACKRDAGCGDCPNATPAPDLLPRTAAKLAFIKCPDGCNSFPCQCPPAPRVIREQGKPDIVIGLETDEQQRQRLGLQS